MARVFISPSKYVQGPGELTRLGEYAKAYGMTFLGQPRTHFAAEPHVPENRHLLPLCIPAAACVLVILACIKYLKK